jgi:hypothetical protein
MKNALLPLGLAAIFCFSACKERPFEIPNLSVGKRRVLVEEATGVRCAQCPDGAKTLTSLQGTFAAEGRELIVVSIHAAGNFSVPYSNSLHDFRNPDAQALVGVIGPLEGFPSSAINRRLLPNELFAFITPASRWEGVIRSDFGQDYGVDMFVANSFNPTTRQLFIKVDILPDQLLTGDNRLTVLITQDSIVDMQLDKNVMNTNYVHRHVLRDVVTAIDGDVITEPIAPGTVISKSFNVPLLPAWEAKHCSVVAFIHRGGNPNKEVLQAAESHVIQ